MALSKARKAVILRGKIHHQACANETYSHYTILYLPPAAQMRSPEDSKMDHIQSRDHTENAC